MMKENGTIVVPVDGSQHARHAAAFAGTLAEALGASIDLLFVKAFDEKDAKESRVVSAEAIVASMQSPDTVFDEAKEGIPEGVTVNTQTLTGLPSKKVVDYASEKKADMIVIGGKGTSAVEGFLIGSVSQFVIDNADCSVIIVK